MRASVRTQLYASAVKREVAQALSNPKHNESGMGVPELEVGVRVVLSQTLETGK